MSTLLPLLLGLSLFTQSSDVVESDLLTLANGRTAEGQVVYEDDTLIILRKGSRETEYPRAEVTAVDSRLGHLGELLQRMEQRGPDLLADAPGLLELARFAAAARLPGEAEMLHLLVLLADPAQQDALDVLGCKERKGHWSYKKGSTWIRVADLRTAVTDWKDRWTFTSMHYTVEASLPLDQAILAAFDLERFYRAFMGLLRVELRITEPLETMRFLLHDDARSYPEPSDGRRAWFDQSDLLTHVNTTVKPWLPSMFHEAAHHIFYMTTVRSRDGKGVIPAWLDEGMAEFFETGSSGSPGFSTFDLVSPDPNLFRTHAKAEKPHDFSRVLAFEAKDYQGSVGPELKYAQSYTLLHFVLYGNAGDRRLHFMDFMRSAYQGRSSSTDFQKILEIDNKDKFEKEWFASVSATVAGL